MDNPAEREVENRRRRLRAWIDAHYGGVPGNFVRAHQLNQGEISGLLSKKSFGSRKARNLEVQVDMPERYLDMIEGEAAPASAAKPPKRQVVWPFSTATLAEVEALSKEDRLRLDGALGLALTMLRKGVAAQPWPVDIAIQKPGDILPIGSPANDEYVEVHRYDVKFAGGNGRESYHVDAKAKLAFRADFLKSISVRLKNAMIVYLDGPSHEPVIPSGSALLVDRGVTEMHTLENGGKGWVYAFWWEKGLAIKRLVCQADGAIMAYSYNPAPEFAPFQINKDAFKIIGRVKWMGTRL